MGQRSRARTLISVRIVSRRACSLMGSTIPVVPRMEMPPTMPSFGLKVFSASARPSGTEMVTERPTHRARPGLVSSLVRSLFGMSRRSFESSCRAPGKHSETASRTACAIMARGVLLMAAAPTGWSSPGLVTRPTPSPPSIEIPGWSDHATHA